MAGVILLCRQCYSVVDSVVSCRRNGRYTIAFLIIFKVIFHLIGK